MNNKLKIKNDQGIEKEYDILFSFESDNTGKTYIAYTDFTKDENNIIKVYSSIYEDGNLSKVDTDAENQIIEEMLNTISETAKTKYQIINE